MCVPLWSLALDKKGLSAKLTLAGERTILEVALNGSDHTVPARLARAVELLLSLDAGIVWKLKQVAPCTLSWSFDPRPGHERDRDRALDLVLPLLLPRRVNDQLYPFQRTGVAWLLRRDCAILADDMGLGKTIQVIAALRRLFRAGRISFCLVVAPKTLRANWEAEARRWAPELVVGHYTSSAGRGRVLNWKQAAAQCHVLIASYEDVRDPPSSLLQHPPDVIVADEAHRLRKSDSLAHKGLRRIKTKRLWALTGTPVERDADDLAGLLSLLEPIRFAVDDARLGPEILRARARPYILRRLKESVLPELPPVTERTEVVVLSPAQRSAYSSASQGVRQGEWLALFNDLRTICDMDPTTGDSSKLNRAVELLKEITDRGEKCVVFSYTLGPLRELARRLRAEMGDNAALLTGELELDQRGRIIRRFRTDAQCSVLLASMRVASEGLTLTEANHAIFINRWWNPSTNSQAIDRIVRIGQHKPVTIYNLTCTNTVEDRLQPLLDRKELTFAQLIDALQHRPDFASKLLQPDIKLERMRCRVHSSGDSTKAYLGQSRVLAPNGRLMNWLGILCSTRVRE